MARIELRNIYKMFGPDPKGAIEALRSGAPRNEVQEKTGTLAAVIDATFTVEPGEVFVVMGLSGSGKSTLVRTINRLHEPSSGQVLIDGEDVTALDTKELRRLRAEKVSMVFQHFALFPHRTVLENAAWGLEASGMERAKRSERARRALAVVGLDGWEDKYPQQLSGGMQQRVGLARALATDADILLMDEAFSALDPLIRREMQDQLLELQSELGNTVVFITHDLNEAMRIGDRIAMMKDGSIVQIGTAEEILQEPANDYVASFVQDVDRSRVLTASSVMEDPLAIVGPNEGPRLAIEAMRKSQVSAVFVIGPHRRMRGVLRDTDAVEASKRGDRSVEALLTQDFERVKPDTPLVELFAPAASSPLPLAVVDDEGRLVGVIPRVTLLNALGEDHSFEGETQEGSMSDA
ncbi:MAG: glycine betaine/L-proline ABC transporter ATP-binding protein [Actinomycetota bacterium]